MNEHQVTIEARGGGITPDPEELVTVLEHLERDPRLIGPVISGGVGEVGVTVIIEGDSLDKAVELASAAVGEALVAAGVVSSWQRLGKRDWTRPTNSTAILSAAVQPA